MTALLLLLACTAATDAESLRAGDCDAVRDADLREQCRASAGTCAAVADDRLRGECWFRAAEKADDPALCAKAAPFVDDCRMHVLSAGFQRWAPRDVLPGDAEAQVEARIRMAGLAADDPRPWSAWYRHVLGLHRPIDRSTCARVTDAARREACAMTGLALYADLLNMARDRGLYPCDGSELPRILRYAPDPDLDALRAARTDLCP